MADPAYDSESARLPEMRWASIRHPGCYLVTRTGRLIRLTQESMHEPEVRLTLHPTTWMALVSTNPLDPAVVLRLVASAHGYFVNF